MSNLHRREFLQLGLTSGAAFLSFHPLARAARSWLPPGIGMADTPLRPLLGAFTNPTFLGDNIQRAHDRLGNVAAYIAARGGRPQPSEKREVVVLGGGIAGLSAAYFLAQAGKSPLVLEQDAQFGGNARGEILGDTPFASAATMIKAPEPNGTLHRMLLAVGALGATRMEDRDDSREWVTEKGFQNFWNGDADPEHKAFYDRFNADLTQIVTRAYPQIPWRPNGTARAVLDAYDRLTLAQWFGQKYGTNVPPLVIENLQLFCWQNFGASLSEVSAAQALNLLAGEVPGRISIPGGNAAIAQGLYNFVQSRAGANSLRAGHFVLDVKVEKDEVWIVVETPSGTLQTIACRACIVALPKFVALAIVPGMTEAQKQVATNLRYRSFATASVLVKNAGASPALHAQMLRGQVPPNPYPGRPSNRGFADVTFANWAASDKPSHSILTFRKSFPFEGGRVMLANPMLINSLREEARQNAIEILAAVKATGATIDGIRVSRWGHGIPLAQPGFLASHSDEVFKSPTGGKIYYANQDNDANPSFEAAFLNAELAVTQILRGA